MKNLKLIAVASLFAMSGVVCFALALSNPILGVALFAATLAGASDAAKVLVG